MYINFGVQGATYGVGSGPEVEARRSEASPIKRSSSFNLGTTCLAVMMLSNSFYKKKDTHPHVSQVSLSSVHHHHHHHYSPSIMDFCCSTYLTLLTQLVHHLGLDLAQHTLCAAAYSRIAGRKVIPCEFAERAAETLGVEILETGGAGAWRNGGGCGSRIRGCSHGIGRGGGSGVLLRGEGGTR